MKKVIKFILVIICMITIFMFSNDNGYSSTNKSNKVITDIVYSIHGRVSKDRLNKYIDKYVFIVRKTAHFSLYFILGGLVVSLIFEYTNKNTFIYSLLIVIMYAISDEVHQAFVPGRSARIGDVLIDTMGGACAIILYYILRRRVNEQKKRTC